MLIPAGGLGLRLGKPLPKALVPLCGVPLLVRTLRQFAPLGLADAAVVVIPPSHRADFESVLADAFPGAAIRLVDGGEARQDSVRLGLAALDLDTELCVIHDAARPFITPEIIQASIDAAANFGAATVAIPSVDTILMDDGDGFLRETPDRSLLWACQTPQTFRVAVIRDAHEQALRRGFKGTDDATLVRHCGHPVKLVPGSPHNLKVTTPTDLYVAAAFIEMGIGCE